MRPRSGKHYTQWDRPRYLKDIATLAAELPALSVQSRAATSGGNPVVAW